MLEKNRHIAFMYFGCYEIDDFLTEKEPNNILKYEVYHEIFIFSFNKIISIFKIKGCH